MRVLQFGRYDFDENKGGVQFYADALARHLSPEIEVDLLVSAADSKTKVIRLGSRLKVAVASFGLFASVPVSPTIFYWARKLARERKYDLIHLNFPDPLGLLAALFLPRRIPIVVTWHSDIVRQKFLLRFYEPLLKFFMKRVSRVIVATPRHIESCSQLRDLKMSDQTVVIPLGIEEKDFELQQGMIPEIQKIRERAKGKFLLFTFGRHVYYKGYEYLVEAMKLLPNCYLILGGKGPLTESLKAKARELGVQNQIEFMGPVPPEELPIYLRACDLFCFPSVDPSEAFGYAQVEAMVSGKAVVAGDLKNGVNFVNLDGETGLNVPPRNAEALAKAIQTLANDPELLSRLSTRAQERALQEFTATKTAERTKKLFFELVASSSN